DEEDGATSFWVKVGPRREPVRELDLEHILVKTCRLQEGQRLPALTKGYIQMCRDADGKDAASPGIPAHKWLAAEVSLGTSHFFFHEGHWYEVGDRHLESIQQQVRALLQTPAGLSLIDWTADLKDEKEYNREAAKHGYICLDRALIETDLHPRGFETCDLFGPGNELIHVKRAKSTAPLNHLFAQGRIWADALRWDSTARSKFLTKVRERDPQHPVRDDFMPKKVIYGISLRSGKPLTVENLFTFAQVSLLQAAIALRNSGTEVAVVNIPTVPA
ncbi:MAG: TIGR04141 family sporadically distributed protein, partial [Actinobacteria bacterium]|nr:TIGR04141 family sporadically distributed protein [Actinomycetota bacterium]